MSEQPLCQLCGNPMPEGEESFVYHGYSGPCPPKADDAVIDLARRGSEPPQSPANPPLSAPTNTDELEKILDDVYKMGQENEKYDWKDYPTLKPGILKKANHLIVQKQIEAMKQAQSRVLRRTEIPKDAREPTRDAIVILGEEIAGIIERDIVQLKGDTK
jgi:hypothetical protein